MGMIYASLKPIPQWHTPLLQIGYFVLGHYSGALLLLAVLAYGGHGEPFVFCALGRLVLAAAVKAFYYTWMQQATIVSTINSATGIARARVRLLDTGHSHGTFLTKEFGFSIARPYAAVLKVLVFVATFVVPLVVLLAFPQAVGSALFAIAWAATGLLVERWIFFAEAKHVVRLCHGF